MNERKRTGNGLWIGVGVAVLALVTGADLHAAGQVTGKYLGNGQEAKLAHAIVLPHEDWSGEKAYTLIFSEQDPKGVKKPDFDAMFGKLGHALVVHVTASGSVFGTQICHQALAKSGFSSSGTVEAKELKVEGGKVSGQLRTDGEKEFFGDLWEIDLTFEAVPHSGK